MYMFLKICVFGIYTLGVYLFTNYLWIWYSMSSYNDWFLNDVNINGEIYDFIVVGAGSAGSIVAMELCRGGNKVLLIEAGASPAPFFNVPILSPLLQGSPYDWGYKTTPQDNACKALSNNQSVWPQGKVLGGSSRLNYMAYVTGHSKDYQHWFPDFNDDKFKENNGIINEPRWCTHLYDAILDAIKETLPDKKNVKRRGEDFSRVRLTMKNGERWSTDKLLENELEDRLRLTTHALVNNLIFDGDVVKGVNYIKWGKKLKALAKDGVIVSAGAIGSPKLLMLSGIGPKEHLQELQINVINDLPVGKNLVDHILTGVDLVVLNETLPLSIEQLINPISALNYLIFRGGPWTSAGIEAVGTFYTPSQDPETEAPALQLMIIPVGISRDNGVVLRRAMGITDEVYREYFAPLVVRNAITIAPVLLHPKSSGRVRLRSTDASDDPLIDPKYLSRFEDVATLISGIRLVKRLVNTEGMKKLGATMYEKHFPGCENFVFDSSEYWECYVRHLTLTSYHPAGTCRMGSVVDQYFRSEHEILELGVLVGGGGSARVRNWGKSLIVESLISRVYNTKNLYVVDASVLPELPSGNINAAVMRLARKAGGLLNSRSKKRSRIRDKLDVYLRVLYGEGRDITCHKVNY